MASTSPAVLAAGMSALDVSLARIISTGLVPATAAADVTSAVRALLAIQGQQVSAVPHALLVRTPTATAAQVGEAFDRVDLVRSWPMRGTVHITTAEDHHWLRAALVHRYDRWVASSAQEHGMSPSRIDEAGAVALALIAAEGPVGRARLVQAWVEAGIIAQPVSAGAGATITQSWEAMADRRYLLMHLHLQGLLVQAPVGKNEHLLIDASVLPPETLGPAAGEKVGRGEAGHEVAMAVIAHRYAWGHGPVGAADLARWLSVPVGEAHVALEGAQEMGAASGLPLVRMLVGEDGSLRRDDGSGTVRERRQKVVHLRADLPDLLAAHRIEAAGTFFLGSFDELHVGYKDRACLTDAAGEKLICPSSNGMFRPLLIDRGRVVAVRPPSAGLIWMPGQPASKRLAGAVDREIRRMEARLRPAP